MSELRYHIEEDKSLIYDSKTNHDVCMYFDDENRDMLLNLLNQKQTTDMNHILKDNLSIALATAIKQQSKLEKKQGYITDSALLAGWRDNLRSLENAESLIIK